MLTKEQLIEFSDDARKNYLDHVSIDCVVFGFYEGQMKVLLLQPHNEDKWLLPGGFVRKQEPIEMAADRILKERTGLDKIFLQQFHVFGDPDRAKFHSDLYKDMLPGQENWFSNRFLSIGYYALVNFSGAVPQPDQFSDVCAWRDMDDMPPLLLDHEQIFKSALDTLRLQLNYQPIGYNLMPQDFTMPELQKLYETILGKKLDRRNFQRRILAFGILNRADKPRRGGAHKAPYLYSFDLENYSNALTEGFRGGW
jgi:ADP-ribose pyrophosphatase YjhB (NUDIX family)